jgi:catechol 2,3-dioxygenase-like lactoylglutathione lyase family enzyme
MATTPALNFVVFYVSDLKASLAYFTDILGFIHVPEQDAPAFHALTGGADGIDFGIAQASAETPAPGAVELFIKTADLKRMHATVSGKGVEATAIEPRPFGSIFTIHTPDGYPLTMMEPPASPS